MSTRASAPGAPSIALLTLFAAVAMVALLAGTPRAEAAPWNPKRFARMLKWADKAFTDARYAKAKEVYVEARAYLQSSLDAGEISDDQVERARLALGTIDYQLARTTQLASGCHEGYLAFKELRSTERLEFAVAVKVEVRMAETLLCRAQDRIKAGDWPRATADVDQAGSLLAAAGERRLHVALNEAQADDIRQSLQMTMDTLVAELNRYETWEPANCDVARNVSRVADSLPTAVIIAGMDELRVATVQSCAGKSNVGTGSVQAPPQKKAPEVQPIAERSWGPWVLMGVGGAALLGVGVNELRLVPTIGDFEDARDECASIGGSSCTQANIFATDVESGQVVSMALLGIGAVAIVGGVIWWLLDEPASEAPSTNTTLVPIEGGALIGVSLFR